MPETNTIHNSEFVALAKSVFDEVCTALRPSATRKVFVPAWLNAS